MGGTALAVHLRHRRSDDLDLFTSHVFDPDPLHAALGARGDFRLTTRDSRRL